MLHHPVSDFLVWDRFKQFLADVEVKVIVLSVVSEPCLVHDISDEVALTVLIEHSQEAFN